MSVMQPAKIAPGATERATRASKSMWKETTCKNCGGTYEQLVTRYTRTCKDCRPYKRGCKA